MALSSTLTVSVSKFLSLANKWSLYLAILVWPFGHLLKFSNIYLLDIVCFLVFITFTLGDNFNKYKTGLLFKSLNVFWFSLLVSILYALWKHELSSPTTNLFYYLRVLAYPFLAFSYFVHKSDDLKKISVVSATIFVGLAVTQYLLLPDLRIYKNLGFDDHYYRLAGTLVDPNFTGAILATFAILFLVAKKYFASLVLIVSLALTFSRASYLAFVATMIPFVVNKKFLKLLWIVLLLALAVYFSPKPFGEGVNLFRTYSIFSRVESIRNGVQLFLEKPITGQGFGMLTNSIGDKVSVDNSYVYLLASSGLLGLASFVSVLFAVLKTTKKDTYLLLLPILIHSLFNNSFFYIWIMSLFWVLVGYSFKENKSA